MMFWILLAGIGDFSDLSVIGKKKKTSVLSLFNYDLPLC